MKRKGGCKCSGLCSNKRCSCVKKNSKCSSSTCGCSISHCLNQKEHDVVLPTTKRKLKRAFRVQTSLFIRYNGTQIKFVVPSDMKFSALASQAFQIFFNQQQQQELQQQNFEPMLFLPGDEESTEKEESICPPGVQFSLIPAVIVKGLDLKLIKKQNTIEIQQEQENEGLSVDNEPTTPATPLGIGNQQIEEGYEEEIEEVRESPMIKQISKDVIAAKSPSATRLVSSISQTFEFPGISSLPTIETSVKQQQQSNLQNSLLQFQQHRPHLHCSLVGNECKYGCLFFLGQAGELLQLNSNIYCQHDFVKDSPISLFGRFIVTKSGNVFECSLENNRVSVDPVFKPPGCEIPLSISAKESENMFISSDGLLYCIGKVISLPYQPFPAQHFKAVSSCKLFSVAITASGTAIIWGDTQAIGIVNECAFTNAPIVLSFPMQNHVISISCGLSHVLMLIDNGTVFSFGEGQEGRLGLGDESPRNYPQQIPQFQQSDPVISISCGDCHSTAVTFEGSLFSWGQGKFGALGHGSQSNELSPRQIASVSHEKFIMCVCEKLSTAAITNLGDVITFGFRMTPHQILEGYPIDALGTLPRIALRNQSIEYISVARIDDESFYLLMKGKTVRGTSTNLPIGIE